MPLRKFVLPRNNDGEGGLPPAMKKPRAGKQRPEGMSNTAWAADVARLAVVNQERCRREATTKMKKAAAATAASYGLPHTALASLAPKVASLL
jgi:hypothetical protein